jgi:DNA-binding NarL/FixJ family response regulator
VRSGRAAQTRGRGPCPRIVIADAYAPFRLGLRIALEAGGFAIAGEATTGQAAVARALAEEPDICLIDLSLPGGSLGAARAISTELPRTAVVMLATASFSDDLLRAIRAGASGYLLKTMDVERLPVALHAVLDGEAAIPRAMVARLVEEIQERERPRALPFVRGQRISLTPREAQVLELMRHELATREIAGRLGISEVTVRRHASAVMRKLDVPDRRAAVGLVGLRGGANGNAERASA